MNELDAPLPDEQSSERPEPANNGGEPERAVPLPVRYGAMAWIGDFSVRRGQELGCGTPVVVQTDRGIELGARVMRVCSHCQRAVPREQIRQYVRNSGPDFCRPRSGRILREATPADVDEHARLNATVQDDVQAFRELAQQHQLEVKVVTAEHLLGGERIVFYFCSEDRIDFRGLVRELAQRYQTRIEMRQVGARDEARLVADWEVCGRECCCKNFLKKLRPVSMKMAKLQKSTLDPSKVSGRCGRLRCCLRYEQQGYEELAAKLPNRNARVMTPDGPATVLERHVLTQLVLVRTDDGREASYPLDEIRLGAPPAPPVESRPALPVTDAGPRALPRAAPTPPPVPAEADVSDESELAAETEAETTDVVESGGVAAATGAPGATDVPAEGERPRRGRRRRGRRGGAGRAPGGTHPGDAGRPSDAARPNEAAAAPPPAEPQGPRAEDSGGPRPSGGPEGLRRRRRRRRRPGGEGRTGAPPAPET